MARKANPVKQKHTEGNKKAGTVLHVWHNNSHPDVSLTMVQLLALHREPGYTTKILPLSKENNLNMTVSSVKENSNTLC